jgi:hypothetical protein
VAAWEASGEKLAPYCRRHGLNYWTFREWRKRLRPMAASKRQALVPVMVRALPAISAATLELRVGARMTLSVPTSVDAVWLGTVLREASSC